MNKRTLILKIPANLWKRLCWMSACVGVDDPKDVIPYALAAYEDLLHIHKEGKVTIVNLGNWEDINLWPQEEDEAP